MGQAHSKTDLRRSYPSDSINLDNTAIHSAQQTPRQQETPNSDWSCGPHSLFRAKVIVGQLKPSDDVSKFVEECPRTFNLDLGSGWRAGPPPNKLAEYGNARHGKDRHGDFPTFVSDLLSSLRNRRPVVVLIWLDEKIAGINLLHYVCVIGWTGGDWRILDTDNRIYYMSPSEFEKRTNMAASSVPTLFVSEHHHGVFV